MAADIGVVAVVAVPVDTEVEHAVDIVGRTDLVVAAERSVAAYKTAAVVVAVIVVVAAAVKAQALQLQLVVSTNEMAVALEASLVLFAVADLDLVVNKQAQQHQSQDMIAVAVVEGKVAFHKLAAVVGNRTQVSVQSSLVVAASRNSLVAEVVDAMSEM